MADKKLHISDSLSLPLDFVTSTHAILAKKRSGKSYTAQVLAEELLGAEQQIVALDPTGAWWGLRSSSDGRRPGFPIAVLGGEHGDVPLEATAGEVIANAIVTERFSCVIDTSLFSVGEEQRFAAAFLATLYRRSRQPLHLFVDEADVFAPQKPFGEEAKTLGAMQNVVRRGGIRGIGCTLITQRPQVLNKDVLSQVDMLTTLRMNHPKDLGAIEVWVAVHGDPAEAKKMITSLPSLPVGDAWVWAPAQEIFERVTVRRKTTFDSGATPKAGQQVAPPKVLASVDIARLGATIASTVEAVKANDPQALRTRVAELEKQLAHRPATAPKAVERPAVDAETLRKLQDCIARVEARTVPLGDELNDVASAMAGVGAALRSVSSAPAPAGPARSSAAAPAVRRGTGAGDTSLPGGERKLLIALAQYPSGRTKQQVAILTGYAHNGGGFNNYLGSLRSKGLIAGEREALTITDAGVAALGEFTPLPSGRALFDHWQSQLGKAEREILRVLFEEWPDARPKEYVAVKAGYQPNGGGFNNALGKLRTLDLIEGRAKLKASDQLQDGAS